MPAILITILFVAGIIALFEIILTRKVKLFDRINSHSWGAGAILSVALGWLVTTVLGITGAIAGMATMLAMVTTDTFWAARRKVRKDPNNFRVRKLRKSIDDTVAAVRQVIRAIRILTMPIWVPVMVTVKILAWFDDRNQRKAARARAVRA